MGPAIGRSHYLAGERVYNHLKWFTSVSVQTEANGLDDGLGPVGDGELVVDARQVVLDRLV